jgi:hypothetical protein
MDIGVLRLLRGQSLRIRRLGYALCGDWHLAEDLVQYTFLQLYLHWKRLDATTLDAYARRTLVNACLSHKRNRRHETVLAEPPDRPSPAGADVAGEVGTRLDVRRALMERIRTGTDDVLVVWEISRRERDLAVYVQIRDLCFDLRDRNDRMFLGFQAVQAEFQADYIRDNVKRGIDGASAAGRPHGGSPTATSE